MLPLKLGDKVVTLSFLILFNFCCYPELFRICTVFFAQLQKNKCKQYYFQYYLHLIIIFTLIRPLCNRLKILDSCTSCIVETYRYSSSVSSIIPTITLSSYCIPCYYFISAMTEKLDFTLFRLAHLSHPMMAET